MSFMDDINTGREAYHRLDTVSDSKSSLKIIRNNAIYCSRVLKISKEKMEEENKKDRETFIKSIADANAVERQKKLDETADTFKVKLKEGLSAVLKAKKEASRKYLMTPPSQDQLNLISYVEKIGADNFDDVEWKEIVKSIAPNPLASKMLERITKDSRREFFPPVTIANVDADLEQIEKLYLNGIDCIDDPYRNVMAVEFYRDDLQETQTSILTEKLDREIASTNPSSSLSPKNRLREAANHALHVGNYDLFNQIGNFIRDNISRFETKEEAEADFASACEELIKAGNNAKEIKKTPYERQRDKVIDTLEKMTDDKKGSE